MRTKPWIADQTDHNEDASEEAIIKQRIAARAEKMLEQYIEDFAPEPVPGWVYQYLTEWEENELRRHYEYARALAIGKRYEQTGDVRVFAGR